MAKFINRIGMKFGKLEVIEYLGNRKWKCKCDCGNETIVDSGHLRVSNLDKSIKSCGCNNNSKLI